VTSRIESEKLSVRQTEDAIREKLQSCETLPFAGGETGENGRRSAQQPHSRPCSSSFARILGTKVDIRLKGKEVAG